MTLYLVRMSGAPGSGKTTLARTLAPRVDAVIVDHDITKSTLLNSGLAAPIAGRASYDMLIALARHLLDQGRSVIVDSPCYYVALLERGQTVAREAGATYRYVECRLEDLDELDRRLRDRTRHRSQLAGVYDGETEGSGRTNVNADAFREWIRNMKRPAEDYLVVDTSQPLDDYLDLVVAYVGGAHRGP